MNLTDLSKPIENIKWRVQSFKETKSGLKACCIPYVDARDVQKRLDDVCGIENWQDRYIEVKGNLFCEIGIFINGEWRWKSDVGTESNIEKQKGEASDAFKRAAVMWGIGRGLYQIKTVFMEAIEVSGKKYPINKITKKAIYDGTVLSEYINKNIKR